MKIAYVEMAGFRGFKEPTRIDFPAGFVVLTGRNGAGKSTILDAIDFALTGSIHKYLVTNAKGGGLGEHIWWMGNGSPESHYVSVGFIDENGSALEVRRSRDRGLENDLVGLATSLCGGEPAEEWPTTLIRTSLIRDETISALSLDLPEQQRFLAVREAIGGLAGPDHSKRTGEIYSAAKDAKGEQDKRTKELQAELGRTLSSLTEARSAAERLPSSHEADRLIAEIDPSLVSAAPEVLARTTAERRAKITAQLTLVDEIEATLFELARRDTDQYQSEVQQAAATLDLSLAAEAAASLALQESERKLEAARAIDEIAGHLAQIAKHGESVGLIEGHCPLCDAVRSEGDFISAIRATRERLNHAGSLLPQVIEERGRAQLALRNASDGVERARSAVSEYEHRTQQLSLRFNEIRGRLAEISDLFPADPNSFLNPEIARSQLLREQERNSFLERALYIRQSSASQDRVAVLESRVTHLRQSLETETAKLAALERAQDAARQIDTAAKSVANEVLTEQFDVVLPLLKELYRRLRPHTDWREIEIDFGGTVRASLNFTVGDGRNPQFLFSSGQRRAAGIAFLLAIHLSRPWCKLRTLLMDDPVQHIDDYRALNLVEVLSAVRNTGRQVIVAVEDIALAELLCRRLRSTGTEPGVRLELAMSKDGSAKVEKRTEIFALPREVLAAVS